MPEEKQSPGTDQCVPHRSLAEFGNGKYGTIKEARATFKIAIETMLKSGGGILCIPQDAPAGFKPWNSRQTSTDPNEAPVAVTIHDDRNGVEHVHVPPAGRRSSEGTHVASKHIERQLKQTLQMQATSTTLQIASRYLGGASSYSQSLLADVKVEKEGEEEVKKFRVPTLRGLFVGQKLGSLEIESLGTDKTSSFFVARTSKSVKAGASVYNKNVVNGLTIKDDSNCDNQAMSLIVDRRTRGAGDSFGIWARLRYQSDIMSGGGDEGGVGVTTEISPDLDYFRGEVDSWDARTGTLVYTDDDVTKRRNYFADRIGTSRPARTPATSPSTDLVTDARKCGVAASIPDP